MSHLPAQQPKDNTYLETPGICRSLERLQKDDEEGVVTGIWIAILASVFGPKEEYMIRAQSLSPGGVTDLLGLQFVKQGTKYREVQFLVVQAKAPIKETRDAAWEAAKDQLLDYLPHLEPKRKHHKYGIVAVGRWAQFVLYDEDNRRLTALHDGHLHVERQFKDVLDLLHYIRDNH
ncbi:hypothetical protein McanMca71_007707 [Microsporum canis]|uniref:Fungal-type protein kinase domain-containing protein n=1 Tax=Arthroderma otae (strain ATCC MYA-4605 / CBS 113480) TaxID=554155 RepID=C5FNW4_ARTOC|nr:uncharacterized protein MCYG_04636 [Microsporum canis CBS 113480]EEQ31817.1 predicted protein [Microsporum canis CBS 113480]